MYINYIRPAPIFIDSSIRRIECSIEQPPGVLYLYEYEAHTKGPTTRESVVLLRGWWMDQTSGFQPICAGNSRPRGCAFQFSAQAEKPTNTTLNLHPPSPEAQTQYSQTSLTLQSPGRGVPCNHRLLSINCGLFCYCRQLGVLCNARSHISRPRTDLIEDHGLMGGTQATLSGSGPLPALRLVSALPQPDADGPQ